ncbi:MAG TPA: hypothetical protein VFS67_35585 [Polyangiaceae bacterium]|nr:hypothetical protein [Polyangiaceae bacterium]
MRGDLELFVGAHQTASHVQSEVLTVSQLSIAVNALQAELESETRLLGCLLEQKQDAFEARIRELEKLTAQDNWDLEGGHAVAPELWALTRRFYETAKESIPAWIEPFVSPSGDGTVHLTWVRDGGRLNLEICDGRWNLAIKASWEATYKRASVAKEQALALLRDFLG